jgi:hypothetical protein
MATKQTIQVDVQTNLAEAVKLSERLKNNLQAAAAVRIPIAVQAAQAGVTNTKKMATAQPGGPASDTNLSRGIGGQTGASSRDFAAQAQGLGGLVHVYATFAANLFAVSAAFTALSKAADTSNMVKGLDQLGAASGKALGTLAKQVKSASDGALSMRDAITSTALASAGGMNSANILKMTEIAKKASLALGRDMPDSMDRLTKGIVKVQPELLDELGIMARVIPAQEAYARQIGKTVSSLTSFEKQQAFANAVISEGTKKFSEINIDANPYSKILASMTDLVQTGLELTNKVLTPLLSLLSSSPTALAVAMASIGAILLKQAIPAIGMFRENTKRLANEAKVAANKMYSEYTDIAAASDAKAAQMAQKRYMQESQNVDRLNKLKFTTRLPDSQEANKITQKNAIDLTKQEIAYLEERNTKLLAMDEQKYKNQGANLTTYLKKVKAERDSFDKVGDEAEAKNVAKTSSSLSHENALKKISANLNQQSAIANIKSTISETAAREGALAAYRKMNIEIAKSKAGQQWVDTGAVNDAGDAVLTLAKKTNVLQNGWMRLTSTISIVTQTMGTLVNAFGVYAQIAAVIIGLLSYINDYFTKNAHAMEEYTKSIDAGTDAIKLMANVTANLSNIKEGTAFSTTNVIARASAITTLTDAIQDQIYKYKEVLSKAGDWDNIMDSFWTALGRGTGNKLADTINKQLISALNALDTQEAADAATKSLAASLGMSTSASLKDIQDKVSQLGKEGMNAYPQLQKLGESVGKLGDKSKETISKTSELSTALENLRKTGDDLNNSLLPNTLFDKFALGMVNSAFAFSDALDQGPIESLANLNNLLADSKNLSIFSPTQVKDLVEAKAQFEALGAAQTKFTQDRIDAQAKLEKAKSLPKVSVQAVDEFGRTIGEAGPNRQQGMAAASQELKTANERLAATNMAVKQAVDKVSPGLVAEALNKGIALLDKGFSAAASKAAVSIAQANLVGITGVGTAEEADKLRQRSLDAQLGLLDVTYQNTLATIANSNAVEKATAEGNLKTAKPEDKANIQKTIDQLNLVSTIISNISDKSMNLKGLNDLIKRSTAAGMTTTAKAAFQIKSATVGMQTQQVEIKGKKAESKIEARKESLNERLAQSIKDINLEEDKKRIITEQLLLQNQFSGLYDEKISKSQQDLELSSLIAKQRISELTVSKDLAEMIKSGYKFDDKRYVNKLAELTVLQQVNKAEKDILKTKQVAAEFSKKYNDNELKLKQLNEIKDIQDQTASAQIANEQNRLSALESLGIVDKEFVLRQTEKLTLQKLEVDFNAQLRKIDEDRGIALANSLAQQAANLATQTTDSQILTDEIKRVNDLYDKRVASQTTINNLNKDNLGTTTQAGIMQERINKLMETSNSLADSLSSTFGKFGDAVGSLVKGLVESTVAQQKLNEGKKEELKIANRDIKDPTELAKKEGEIKDKYQKKSTILELKSIADTTGAFKKQFSEKTAAYKVLNAVEKAASTMKIAMQAKELLMESGLLVVKEEGLALDFASIGANIAGLAAKGASAVLEALKAPFPLGFAAGAAMAAIVGSLLSSFGGGSMPSVDMTGMTSEDRQKTQGTGQAWMSSNGTRTIQDTGGGVFGDSSAKSTSIVDSLATMKENSIVGLSYDNKMLKALEKIADSVAGAAKSIYSVPGLRQGTNFGTMEGSVSSKGMFGGIPLIGGILDNIFGGGTKSTAKITSAGIKFKGTFDTVMNNVAGSITQYKDVLTQFEKSGGWFGSDSSWSTLQTQTQSLGVTVSTAISDIFKDANQLFLELGKKTGVTAQQIGNVLKTFDISMPVDLMNLTGQALIDELNAVVGTKLSDAAKLIFGGFDKFKQFGEDYLATVLRVVDANDKVDQALRSIGDSFSVISKFDISEAMVKAAGGLSAFMDQAAFFRDNFLSEQEKLAPIQASVTKELARLGISTTTSKDQFKALVLAQDVSTEAGRSMYQSLMDLAPGFIAMTTALDTINNTAAKTTKRLDLEQKIYEALGNSEKVLAMTRQAEIDSLKELDASLVPMQIYLNALQDEATLKGKLTTAYTNESNAIKSTITSLKAASKTITDYRTNLLKSTASILTPAEKYAQAKISLLQTAALATSVISANSTAEDIAARDAAIGQVSSTADAFLAASKEMFASSDQYTQDFATVLDVLDTSATNLSTQQTTAELQLTALDKSVSALDLIKVSTDTTASLLKQLLDLQTTTEMARQGAVAAGSVAAGTAIPAFANGGYASGVSIVGEHGPEVVDFKTPGRVYSNRASNDLFNTKELCAEIKSLREEVNQLRKDQHQQTGNIIAANYDANNRNADQVVEGTEDAIMQQQWQLRNQVKVA